MGSVRYLGSSGTLFMLRPREKVGKQETQRGRSGYMPDICLDFDVPMQLPALLTTSLAIAAILPLEMVRGT